MMKTNAKKAVNRKSSKSALSTQQLLNLKQFVPLQTGDGEACAIEGENGRLYVYLILRPVNISVIGHGEVLSKIRSLQNVLENQPDIQFLCVSSSQSYERNKQYYRQLAENARNPVLQQLCIQEIEYLDEINSTMSTSREFAVLLTYRTGSPDDVRHSVTRAVQLIREQRFHVRIADKEFLKRLLAVYYIGDVYSESIPERDGLQYMEKEDGRHGTL